MSLIDAIKQEHLYINSRLALLKREIHGWSNDKTPNLELLERLSRFFMKFPDEIHHKKENYIYDALIQKGVLESNYLLRLKAEHEQMGALTAKFAEGLDRMIADDGRVEQSLIDDVRAFIDLQELHIADEETQFLPLAETELSEARLAEIGAAVQKDLINDAVLRAVRDLASIDTEIEEYLEN